MSKQELITNYNILIRQCMELIGKYQKMRIPKNLINKYIAIERKNIDLYKQLKNKVENE